MQMSAPGFALLCRLGVETGGEVRHTGKGFVWCTIRHSAQLSFPSWIKAFALLLGRLFLWSWHDLS